MTRSKFDPLLGRNRTVDDERTVIEKTERLIGGGSTGSDERVKITEADSSTGYLWDKLVAGSNVTLTKNRNGSGVETITIAASGGGGGSIDDGDKGDVTVSSSGTVWTIDDDAVTNAKSANMTQSTIKGRAAAAGTGDPTDLTPTQVRTIINVADGATANDTDANLKARANHTGTQLLATISDVTATATEVNYTDGVTSPIQTQLDAKAADANVVHDTGDETVAGVKTFSSDPLIPDEAYGPGWNGSLEPPTKNAVYDKIETVGGGGQTLVDIVVAASGGDYTTLGDALAAASAGDTIFVRSGTYSESAITTTLDDITVIGEGPNKAIIEFGAAIISFDGDNNTIENLGFNCTGTGGGTGFLRLAGDYARLVNCNVTSTDVLLAASGANALITGCNFLDSGTVNANKLTISGNKSRFVNNHCSLNPTAASGNSCIQLDSPLGTFVGNVVERNTTGTANLVYIHSNKLTAFTGNSFIDSSNTVQALVATGDEHINITGNTFRGGLNGVMCWFAGAAVTGNTFRDCRTGVQVEASNCVINGNTIYGPGTVTSGHDGISIIAAVDNTVISGNRIHNFHTGINIADSTCDDTIITAVNLADNGTALTDSGTGTVIRSSKSVTNTDLAIADGGTAASTASAAFDNLKQAATTSATGVVELATTAETETGTDATRAVTPDGLHDMTTLAGAAWFLDEDNMASDSATKTASQQSIKAYADLKLAKASNLSDVGNAATAFGNIKQAATQSATGVVELATAAEVTTGTDADRAVSPDTLAGSDYGKRIVGIQVVASNSNTTTGDGQAFFRVPSVMNGWNLVAVAAHVYTAGTTNTTDIQIRRTRAGANADMLSTKITIDSTEVDTSSAAAAAVINASNDDVNTGDKISIDVDAVHTTPAQGLFVELQFQLP